MIDQETVDRIIDTAQIVDVVSEFVTLRKRGVNYIGLCPFHSERTPSFSVSPSKGICKCFSCGKGGNVVHFIMEHEQLSYYESLKWLAKKYGIEIKEKELTNEEKKVQSLRESMFVINQFAANFFEQQLYNNGDCSSNSDPILYFRSRGFRDDIIEKFQLGFCPTCGYALSKEALKKGYKTEFLSSLGLCYSKENDKLIDRFWGRVIFPIHSLSGKIVGFGGRVLDSRTKGVNMKYINSPESDIYHKSKELYGIFFAKQAIVKQDKCYLVEGYTDVISMHQCGVKNVVASSGTALTKEQIRLIHRFTSNVIILFDGDKAGIKASLRGIDMFLEEGMHVKVCLIPDGDDPDSFARKHNATEFQLFISQHEEDFIRFKTNLGREEADMDPTKKIELVNSIVTSISVIPDSITRAVYIRECSSLLQIDENVLVDSIGNILRTKRDKIEVAIRKDKVDKITEDKHTLPLSRKEVPSEEGITQSKIYRQEEELISLIVRYGEKAMCILDDGVGEGQNLISVTEFICREMEYDHLKFRAAIHQTILEEAEQHIHDIDFCAEKYFTRHLNPSINQLALQIISNNYQLSENSSKSLKRQTDEDRLYDLVPRLLADYKLSIVEEEMSVILKELSNPDVSSNTDRCKAIMETYQVLHEAQSRLAKFVGERVLLGSHCLHSATDSR